MKITKYTTTIALALTVLFTVVSCKNKAEQSAVKTEETTEKVINLAGKKLAYDYGDAVYYVTYKSDKNLHWECIKGDEKGKSANETYVVQRLNNHTLFVSWVEADGLGVSQVVNLKSNTVNCYLKIDKEIISLLGKVSEI